MAEVAAVEVLFPWQVDIGPGGGADADHASGAETFGNEVGLEADLNAAAAERRFPLRFRDVEDFAAGRHLGGSGGAAFGVLEGVLHSVHQRRDVLLEIGIEGLVHAAEQSGGDRGATELAVLHGIHPCGHPAAADESLV